MRRASLLAAMTIATLATLPASPAFADDARTVHGAAVSSLPDDTRRLSVQGRLDGDGAVSGQLSFTHLSDSGLARCTARVTCLEFNPEGMVEVSGVVLKGRTAGGTVLDGRPVAFTLDTAGAQNFSLPKFGTGAADCGGGRPETVPVTRAGLRIR